MQSKFYNERVKNAFICKVYPWDKYSRTVQDTIVSIFNSTAGIEARFEKDFYAFTQNEFEYFTPLLGAGKIRTTRLKQKLRVLQSYLEWCRDQGIITFVDYERHPIVLFSFQEIIDAATQKTTENYYFGSVEEFRDVILEVFKEEQHAMVAACAVLTWFGFTPERISSITKDDVNSFAFRIDEVEFWPEGEDLFYVIERAAFRPDVNVVSNLGGKKMVRTLKYVDSPYLIRPIDYNVKETSSNLVRTKNLLKLISYLSGKITSEYPDEHPYKNLRFNMTSIRKSSLFCKMKKIEDEGEEAALIAFCKEYSKNRAVRASLLEDYEQWKLLTGD